MENDFGLSHSLPPASFHCQLVRVSGFSSSEASNHRQVYQLSQSSMVEDAPYPKRRVSLRRLGMLSSTGGSTLVVWCGRGLGHIFILAVSSPARHPVHLSPPSWYELHNSSTIAKVHSGY